MGARALRAWLLAPLTDRAEIEARHEAVGELAQQAAQLDELRSDLAGIQDLERLAGRIAAIRATPRDLAALRLSLQRLPGVATRLSALTSPLLREIGAAVVPLPELLARLEQELGDEPPITTTEGGIAARRAFCISFA